MFLVFMTKNKQTNYKLKTNDNFAGFLWNHLAYFSCSTNIMNRMGNTSKYTAQSNMQNDDHGMQIFQIEIVMFSACENLLWITSD